MFKLSNKRLGGDGRISIGRNDPQGAWLPSRHLQWETGDDCGFDQLCKNLVMSSVEL